MWVRLVGPFTHDLNEQVGYFKNCNSNSNFAQNLQEKGHASAPNEEIMDALHVIKKGNDTNSLEKCIYVSRNNKNQPNR
jgi:hypothetical protein